MDKNLVIRVYGEKYYNKLNNKIKSLGTDNKINIISFMNIRLYLSIILFLIPIILRFTNNLFKYWYIDSVLIFILSYILIKYLLLDIRIKRRKIVLEEEAYYFFEVLTLTLQTGRNLEKSIEITCNYIDNEISKEFKQMLLHIKLGKSFKESLDSMRERIPSRDINNIILSMSEASNFGTNVVSMMEGELEYLNQKQILRVKEEINKIPNKISIISVLFIVPLILLIILSPVIIKMLF